MSDPPRGTTGGRLAGKTGVVTGVGRGIGKAIARRFASEGARLILAEIEEESLERTAQELRDAGAEVRAVPTDVGRREDLTRLFAEAAGFGPLDFLINNAARDRAAPFLEVSPEELEATLEVGLKSVFWACQMALPLMTGGGSVVNVSSVNQILASPHMAAYTAAKGGVSALTRQIAVEYGPHGVRCNSLSPGLILTELMQELLSEDEQRLYREAYPLGRLGGMDDVANAALFLASDESAFVTGIDLVVDGGLTALSPAAVVAPRLRQRWGRPPLDVREEDQA